MSLTVKVFFERANGSKEIRRFPMNTSACGNLFTYTKNKIRRLYPALADGRFTLYWQDHQDDRITFSSSEEMNEAITCASDNVLCVYVSESEQGLQTAVQHQQQQPSESQSHSQSQLQRPQQSGVQNARAGDDGRVQPGWICNECRVPLTGLRYKCCTCPYLYVCQACEGVGVHLYHDMRLE